MQRGMEDKKEKIKSALKITKKYIVGEILIAASTFSLAVFSARKFLQIIKEQEIEIPQMPLSQFITSFLFLVLFIILLASLPKIKKVRRAVYSFLFIVASLYGLLIILSSFLNDLWSLVLGGLLFLCWLYFRNVLFHDILMIFAIAGISVPLGLSLTPRSMIFLLLIFSIYDYIAVYKTKHMQKMAKTMMKEGVITAFFIPEKIKDLFLKTKEVKPQQGVLILGGGDIAFPLLFTISALPVNYLMALLIAIFSLLGIIFSNFLFLFQKERKPMPALPPISLFAILGYIIAVLIIYY